MGLYSALRGGKDTDTKMETKDLQEEDKVVLSVRAPRMPTKLGSAAYEEARNMLALAWPLILHSILMYSIPTISLMFVGHLGELELSSASIATSFANVTGFILMQGVASTLETLCGQAYGARNLPMVGVYLQSAWIVSLGLSFFVMALWMNMAAVLRALGQDPEVARMAEKYLIFMIPGVFGSAILRPTVKFLQSQYVVMPLLWLAALVVALHVGICMLMIHSLGMGFTGGALSSTISFQLLTILLITYTWGFNKNKDTWTGFTWKAFNEVGLFLKLGIPSTLMTCLEYWVIEILVLSSGLLPNPKLELSLLSISLNTTNLAFMIPVGLCCAASTRVSNELGAYRPNAAKLAAKVIVGMSAVTACCIATLMILGRHFWGKAYSDEEEIVESLADLMPLIAVSALLDGIQGVLSGVARGCGRQDVGAWINLLAFYIIGVPSALYLGFKLHLNAKGLWIGLLLGQLTQTSFLILLVGTVNWENMAEKAQERVCKTEPLLVTNGELS